jgi:hypothetical protein
MFAILPPLEFRGHRSTMEPLATLCGAQMKTAAEYMAQAFEFERMANTTRDPVFKKRYSHLAECYRLLVNAGTTAKQQPEQQ